MSSEDHNRVDRREAGTTMSSRPSEDHPDSQGPAASEGGDRVDGNLVGLSDDLIKYIEKRRAGSEFDLDGLIEKLSRLFEQIAKGKPVCQEPEEKLSSIYAWFNNSEGWKKLVDFLSSLIDCVSDLKDITSSPPVTKLLGDIGKASFATAGFQVVEYILEIVQQISENNEECLRLLKRLSFLAEIVKQYKDSEKPRETLILDATQLVVEGVITCCRQMKSDGYSKAWFSSVNKDELDKIELKTNSMYQDIYAQMGVRLLNDSQRKKQPRLTRGYPEHAVEIEDSFREVMGLLEWESKEDAVAVILYGFGGIGKTTLADAVFSRVDLDGCQYSMVEFSENMDSNMIVELQKKIIKDLMGTKNIPEIRKYEEGRRLLSSKLEEVPALIYIDNVLDKDKLRQLLPLNFEKSKKVRLLITARNINVREACIMKITPKEYRMKGISSAASKSLLDKHNSLLTEQMRDNIIESCGGIPLLLTLVAQKLNYCEKDTPEVFQLIEELEKMEGEEFGEKLGSRLIYDNLPKDCKDLFLDICSFFQGREWDMVADILGNALHKLERGGLVTKDTNGLVTVHDIILKIGRRETEGMRFRFTTTSHLQMEDAKVEQIRYLSYKPANDLSELVKMPSNLKYMEIDGKLHHNHLENFPVRLLRLPDLRILKFSNFDGLKALPSELANLVRGLRQLTISNCKSFNELPYSISKLEHLRILKVDHCKSLKVLPEDLGNLTSLVELDLSNCLALTELPNNFGSLSELQVLKLEHCKLLKTLPDGFRSLSSLKVLNLSYCKGLKSLPPEVLEKLTSLVKLDLKGCNLESIPETINCLKSLLSMDISGCSLLKELPDQFCDLSITSLKLTRCTDLEKLPENFGSLKCLRVLKLKSCHLLQKLPESFNELKCLVHLDLSGCIRLEELCRDISGLSSLRTLSLEGCKKLKKLPTDFQSLSSLQHLDLSNCQMLEGEVIDNVVKLKSLGMVRITESAKLVERWGEIQRDQSPDFKVDTGQDLSNEEKESEWNKLSAKFDGILKHGGEPFHVSSRPLDTIILVIFDGHSNFSLDFPWSLIEETLDEGKNHFEMIYIGKHFNKLPSKLANKIIGHAIDNSDARLLFGNLFFTSEKNGANLWPQFMNKIFAMTAKIVEKPGSVNYLSCWERLSKGKDFTKIEEFLLSKCEKYDALKKLTERTQGRNINLLRELFVNVGEENCLVRKSDEVGVDELKGKTIFIEIRLANDSHDHIHLQSLKEMYMTGKDSSEFEIISIPAGQLSTEVDQFSKDIPWLVVQNPCRIRIAVKHFLIKLCQREREERDSERSDPWYPSIVRKIEPNGEIATYKPVLTMLDRWGPEVYPFMLDRWGPEGDQKIKKLRNKEWNEQKGMSSLEFLLKPLKDELDEVKKVMRQGKMTWLLCDGKDPDTKSKRTKTFVRSIKKALGHVMENIHFIYVPHYDEKKKQEMPVTDSIKMAYFPPEEKEELELEPRLHLSHWAAMRFWARVCDLRKELPVMDKDGKMKTLLTALNFGSLSMTLMDKDGKVVTTQGREIMGIFDDRKRTPNEGPAKATTKELDEGPAKATKKESNNNSTEAAAIELIRRLIKDSDEQREKALVELQKYFS